MLMNMMKVATPLTTTSVECLGRCRRPALGNEINVTLQEPFRMFLKIGNRSRTTDEDRVAAVESADPDEAPEDIRQMRTEDPPVDVEFIDHHVLEVRKELLPFRMVGEDPGVEHIRVRNDNVPLPADRLAGVVGGVPIVGIGLDVRLHLADQAVDLVHLVLGKGLGREKVEGSGLRLFEDFLENG